MAKERESINPSCTYQREIYRSFLNVFFSHPLIIFFGVALAITRLTYGLVKANTTLCHLDKRLAILLVTKGILELLMLWTTLLVFRCCKMVERASQNPCFEKYACAFTLTEFVLLVLEIVWCLGYYSEQKTNCPSIDPDWNVHFANFAISQTVIDGLTWIGTIFALCFFSFERDKQNGDKPNGNKPYMYEYQD